MSKKIIITLVTLVVLVFGGISAYSFFKTSTPVEKKIDEKKMAEIVKQLKDLANDERTSSGVTK